MKKLSFTVLMSFCFVLNGAQYEYLNYLREKNEEIENGYTFLTDCFKRGNLLLSAPCLYAIPVYTALQAHHISKNRDRYPTCAEIGTYSQDERDQVRAELQLLSNESSGLLVSNETQKLLERINKCSK